jgi:hypothetical protein
MGKEDQIIQLYTGSNINAISIKEFLEENEIPSFIRDDLYSGSIAGFGAALPGQDTSLFVRKKDFMQAKILLERYLNSMKDQ